MMCVKCLTLCLRTASAPSLFLETKEIGNSLALQWLALHFTANSTGSIPDWGTKVPQALWHSHHLLALKKEATLTCYWLDMFE